MFKILFWCLFIYFLYRFIFDLVVPISRTATQFKRKVAEMQQQQQQAFQEQQQRYQASTAQPQQARTGSSSKSKDDYIEFEELK